MGKIIQLEDYRKKSKEDIWLETNATFHCDKMKMDMSEKWCEFYRNLPEMTTHPVPLEEYKARRRGNPKMVHLSNQFRPFACDNCERAKVLPFKKKNS